MSPLPSPEPIASLLFNSLALASCPLLPLQDCSDKMQWLSKPQLQAFNTTNQPRKRWASVVLVPRRSVKRQRLADCNAVDCSSHQNDQADRASVGSPRSLQYALPGLSSRDTLRVLHTMLAMPSELRHLNGSASQRLGAPCCAVGGDCGWRHLLCQEGEDEQSARRVVWKSAKALEAMGARPLARQIWRSSTEAEDGEAGEVLYTVNRVARVVRSAKRQYGSKRRMRDQVWLECYLDDGRQICVARKELRQFNEHRVPDTSVAECQGFLVRPVFTRAVNSRLAGCSLQCLRAVDSGARSAPALKQQLIDDLPRLTLQCEQDFLYDLVHTPQVLLDSVFAQDQEL